MVPIHEEANFHALLVLIYLTVGSLELDKLAGQCCFVPDNVL